MYAYQQSKLKTVDFRDTGSEEPKTLIRKLRESMSSDQGSARNAQLVPLNIADCTIFPAEDFMDILLNILFPVFLGSKYYARFAQYGAEKGFEEQEHHMLLDGPPISNPLAIRAQELLLGSAAYFDQTVIAESLLHSDWAKGIPRVVDDLSLCITLFDASLPEPRFVYANKAFFAMTGFSAFDLLGKSLSDLLAGEDTDEYQSEQISLAMNSEVLNKYAITHYNKAGKAFINLVSVKNCGHYAVVMHHQANKQSKITELQTVDDVMVLLTCLLKPPPVSELSCSSPVASPGRSALQALPAMLSKLASFRVTSTPLAQLGKKPLGHLGGSAGSHIAVLREERLKEQVAESTCSEGSDRTVQGDEKSCFSETKVPTHVVKSAPFPLILPKLAAHENKFAFGTKLGSKNSSNVATVLSTMSVFSLKVPPGNGATCSYNISSDSSMDYGNSDSSTFDSMCPAAKNVSPKDQIPKLDFQNVRAGAE
eukprot:CAMPEP_0184970602 /NCGR_PEP_ID=MMETSP1098-20130426/3020_1 /TAXON_ID=89044 /ORGANISM="Spumella elongata, Strain CCAP 955/1" /LENGTH=480 /DNA_ID=CAMNT_0027492555 /DNA_START=364 /DNA_END=1806 /DNA_ORIENTATION=+